MKRYKIDNKHVVDVPDEVFSAIRYYSYKERYLKMKDADHNIIHFYEFDTEDSDGENLVRDPSPLPDVLIITNETYNELYNALATLSIEDQLLLYNLFVKGESLRSIALRENSSSMAISRHRDKLFKKLAIILIQYKIKT